MTEKKLENMDHLVRQQKSPISVSKLYGLNFGKSEVGMESKFKCCVWKQLSKK